ncbi:putative urea active transporter protein [Botryosphaeria dothidea]|uniref:Urea active transporter protein n=1 Tax=Botryosphaeria dothidea TaxID=55169 RepID=A0A8H4J7C8_9PEZI|nr:putative urea active transporter protein [Botryosphaeria dothidea]
MDAAPSDAHSAPLSQAYGYGIVVGLGFAFSLGMIFTTWILKRYQGEEQTSEMFSTAGRTVKSGLVSSAVVSSWTWAATLLQSSGVAYRYGVSGPFWYASGATVQILLSSTLAIELKRRAPNAHTFLEVIRARYGPGAHAVYIVFGLMTNILVTAMLLTGGSAVVTSLTGMHTVAGCFLLPLGVIVYTLFGGIKATFLTDYVYTVVILVIIFIFAFKTYATSEILGSPGRVYDLLMEASARHPVDGNAHGSYLTMRSKEGIIFFVINIVGNFGTVFCDNGYYNKAIAAHPVSALPGYIMGGLSWFAIPWLCATTMGLTALATVSFPSFPTYPARMPSEDVTAGLVLPYAAVALLGSGGAIATLILIFMAVTSATSAELIAVSGIATYDIYQTHINPLATGRNLIWTAHSSVVLFGLLMASLSVGLHYAGISMGYLYLLMGVIVSSAVLPASLTLLWRKQNRADGRQHRRQRPDAGRQRRGAAVARRSMRRIRRADDLDVMPAADPEKLDALRASAAAVDPALEAAAEEEQRRLLHASTIAKWITASMALAFLVLWPMPLYGSAYVFSKKFFTGWVVVGIVWLACSTACVGIFPLWQGRKTMARTSVMLFRDVFGLKRRGGSVVAGVEPAPSQQAAHGMTKGNNKK